MNGIHEVTGSTPVWSTNPNRSSPSTKESRRASQNCYEALLDVEGYGEESGTGGRWR